MVVHVYHPYRQPDGINYCAAVNGHCSHLCLPAPQINNKSPKISCACPNGLMLMSDGLMCAEEGKSRIIHLTSPLRLFDRVVVFIAMNSILFWLAILFYLIFFSKSYIIFIFILFQLYLSYTYVFFCFFFFLVK